MFCGRTIKIKEIERYPFDFSSLKWTAKGYLRLTLITAAKRADITLQEKVKNVTSLGKNQ